MADKSLISVVLPVFNEQEGIGYFHDQLCSELAKIDSLYSFELVYVDDGSSDATNYLLSQLDFKNHSYQILKLSRNFGHQAALSCGLDHCMGEAAITMDTDCQHPPATITKFIEKYNEGYDVVFTEREDHDAISSKKKFSSRVFYALFNFMSEQKIQINTSDFRLLSRKVVDVFKNDIRERQRFMRGLSSWIGFKSISIKYKAEARVAGTTKYTSSKMLRLASSGLISFTDGPLKLGIYIGAVMFICSFSYLLISIVIGLISGSLVRGWTSMLSILIFLSSIQFILIGILGLYIKDILIEVKGRPIYLIESKVANGGNHN